jgi:hypothetical protein
MINIQIEEVLFYENLSVLRRYKTETPLCCNDNLPMVSARGGVWYVPEKWGKWGEELRDKTKLN